MYRLLLLILLFYFAKEGFGQKDIYLSIEAGTGSTFVHILDGNSPDLINRTYYPSLTLGLAARYDFNERLSGLLGLHIFNYGYGIEFTLIDSSQSNNRSSSSLSSIQAQRYLSFPLALQSNFNIRKSKPLYLYLLTGVTFGVKVDDMVSGGGVLDLNATKDSVNGVYGTSNKGHRFSLGFVLGTGLEWQTKNLSRFGFKLFIQAGVLKSFEGSLNDTEYQEPLPYPMRPLIEEPAYKERETFGSYFSTNTSLFLTFYYAFNLRKKKKNK
ncbi:MAG: hypothetical protein WD048_11510 [Chitinophagales bacterium]